VRYGSTRFSGKALAKIHGKTLIRHVYERARTSRSMSELVIATDDRRIAGEAEGFGARVVMTSPDHKCGTERVAEAASSLDAEIIVNIQGDEIVSDGRAIDECVEPLVRSDSASVSTLASEITAQADLADPNVVKVVTDLQGNALFFSRSPIPNTSCAVLGPGTPGSVGCFTANEGVVGARKPEQEADREGALGRELGEGAGSAEAGDDSGPRPFRFLRHVGIYAYRRGFLFEFVKLPQTPLELAESLEQLRILEHGRSISVVLTRHFSIGVDVPSDLARAEMFLASLDKAGSTGRRNGRASGRAGGVPAAG
jgi:3-deoxy-manno-octulosonate cytidylyltransferase (CMP-KDO synthetase)